MSQFQPYRTKSIMVSPTVFTALKVLAELEGLDCADEKADLMLGKILSETADLPWLINKNKSLREQLRNAYADHLKEIPR